MTSDERVLYADQLRTSHRISTRAAIYDRNERFLDWVEHPIAGGQVDVDTSRVPERTLRLSLFDPDESFDLGRVFADNFASVEYGVYVDTLAKTVWTPVFFGPITRLGRAGGKTTLEAASKDSLLVTPIVWGHYIRSAGLRGGNVILAWTLRPGADSHSAVQQIVAVGPVIGGTFKLEFGGKVTSALDWDAAAGVIESALEALPNIAPGDVTVTGGPLPKPVTIAFGGALANQVVSDISVRDNTTSLDDDYRYAARFIRVLLRETGERRFAFGEFAGKRLPKNFKLPKEPDTVWSVVQTIVHSVNEHSHVHWRVFYDGAGVLRVENMDNGFAFDERVVLNTPITDYSLDRFRNTTIVGITRGNEARPVPPVVTSLPARHPLSPKSLARSGHRRFIVESTDNSNVRTPKQAGKLGAAQLRRLSSQTVDVAFDSLPVPTLVPGTRCTLTLEGTVHSFNADRFTLGLHAGDAMAVGYNRRIKTRERRPLHVL